MRILVVEDEHRIATALKKGLEQDNYSVDVCFDGEAGLDMALGEDYDLIILDLMLPKLDGISLCKKIREEGGHVPILMLTAKGQIQEKVLGLDSGADDYMVKPFAFSELSARARALIRRPPSMTDSVINVGDLNIDTINYIVKRHDKEIILTKKEYSLLEFLARNHGRLLSKDSIISHVWNYDADVLGNTVEVYIRTLRKKLGKPDIIHTARGFGYKLGN